MPAGRHCQHGNLKCAKKQRKFRIHFQKYNVHDRQPEAYLPPASEIRPTFPSPYHEPIGPSAKVRSGRDHSTAHTHLRRKPGLWQDSKIHFQSTQPGQRNSVLRWEGADLRIAVRRWRSSANETISTYTSPEPRVRLQLLLRHDMRHQARHANTLSNGEEKMPNWKCLEWRCIVHSALASWLQHPHRRGKEQAAAVWNSASPSGPGTPCSPSDTAYSVRASTLFPSRTPPVRIVIRRRMVCNLVPHWLSGVIRRTNKA